MAVRTVTQFKALYGTSASLFPDNTTGLIGEEDLRAMGEDVADSFVNVQNFFVADVIISNAQIDTANSVPVTLVSAPAADETIVLVSASFFLVYSGAAFATNTTFGLYLGSNLVSTTNATLLTRTADYVATLSPVDYELAIGGGGAGGEALKFKIQTGDPTGGGSTQVVAKIVYYIASSPL